MLFTIPVFLIIILGFIIGCRIAIRKIEEKDKKIVIFGFLFFLIALLPFLGLGNITSRYSYLSSVGIVILLAFVGNKAYAYMVNISDRYIGTVSIVIVTITYFMVQLFALQKIHLDWKSAGDMSQRFLVSVEEHSQDSWIKQKQQFYFVNMPIRNGEAWVWPVGLKDALWFTFKNPNITVHTASSVGSALAQVSGSNAHVFKFDSDGGVSEFVRAKNGRIELLYPPK